MKYLPQFLLLTAFLTFVPKAPAQQTPQNATESIDALDHWALEYHTGMLWSIGSNASPLDYTLLPQLFVLKTPAHGRFHVGPVPLVIRSRAALELTPIVDGPESYFAGITFAPSIEWWNNKQTVSTFLSAGGGVGWMDSQGTSIPGAQGQDFNLTWFIHTGLNWKISNRLSASIGARFQHISNGGQAEINPGIDSLGPTLGLSWHW
jgi:lipid A 3-O-deacylase